MNFDLVIAGVGGQGVLSTAGLRLKQSEVHGMAQRGGAVPAFVRLSDAPVASDLIGAGSASLIAAVEPLEALRYMGLLRADGTLVTDVTPMVNIDSYPDPDAMFEVLCAAPNLSAVSTGPVTATMTAAAAKKLKLEKCPDVIALIKSSAIVRATDFTVYALSARNPLAGTISRIELPADIQVRIGPR